MNFNFDFCSTTYSTYPDRPGCTGGDTYVAYQYIRSTGGITTAAEYAYNIYDRRCDNSKRNFLLTVTEAYFVSGEAAILSHIMNYGPLSVYLDATTMYYYTGGIFDACPTNLNINHGASIVGVNLNERYWILRNTWGTQWGEQGYMRLRMVSTYVYIYTYIRTYIRSNTYMTFFTFILSSLLIYSLLVYLRSFSLLFLFLTHLIITAYYLSIY